MQEINYPSIYIKTDILNKQDGVNQENLDYSYEGCNVCGQDHDTECCPELGLLPSEIQSPATTKARLTLPQSMQAVDLPGQEVAVLTQGPISKNTHYGPFEAKKTTHEFSDDSLFLLKVIVKDSVISLDTTSENECNWLCLVRAATDATEQNLIAYQMGTSIFYTAVRDIEAGEELRVWYAAPYAKKIGKSVTPDGVSRVMLNMEVIYPSIEDAPEGFSLEGTHENLTQGEGTPQETTLSLPEHEAGSQELLQAARHVEMTDREQQTVIMHQEQQQSAPSSQAVVEDQESDVVTERTDLPKYGCQRCEQIFTTENDLAHHLMLHLSQTEEKRKRGRNLKNGSFDEDDKDPEDQIEVKEEVNDEDWTAIEEGDPSDPDFKGEDNAAFTVYEVYKGRPRRSIRSKRKIDKDFLYLSNAKKTRKTAAEKRDENSSEETMPSESEEKKVQDGKSGDGNVSNSNIDGQGQEVKVKRGRGRPRKKPIAVQSTNDVGSTSSTNIQTNSMQGEKQTETVEDLDNENVSKTERKIEEDQSSDNRNDSTADSQSVLLAEQHGNDIQAQGDTDDGTHQINNEENADLANEQQEQTTNVDASLQEENDDSVAISNIETTQNTELSETAAETICAEKEVADISADINASITEGEGDVLESDEQISQGSTDQPMIEMDIAEEEETEAPPTDIDNQLIMSEMKRIKNLEKLRTKYKHLCKYCGKHFKNIHHLKLHLPMHTGKFSCRYCGFNFARKESMLKHECKIKKVVNLVEKDGSEVFQCILCDKEMENVKEAKDHYMFHKKEVRCLDCNQMFGRQQLLRDHICPKAPQKLIKCDICKHPFPSEKSLLRHLAMHTDIFKCPNCLKTFARKDSQLKHILVCCPEKADEYKVYACSKCRRGFATKIGLDKHENLCEQEFCENCNKVFDSLEMLKKHQETCNQSKTYVKKDKVLFPCSICKKSFRNLSYLNRHKELHSDQLECSICKKMFKAENDLDDHFKFCSANKTISQKGIAPCDMCDEVFYSVKEYKEHYSTHTHPYYCKKCGKRFVKVGTLHTHQCLQDTSLVECHHCQQQFPGQVALKTHIKKEHRKSFQCKICEKNYITSKEFETHMCVDEFGNPTEFVADKDFSLPGEKPVCHMCGKEFTTTSNLNKHVKIHGEKNVECKYCGKMFHHEEYLKVHIDGVHEKKHKFQCAECGKFLTSKPGLTSHMKQFHSDEKIVYPCSECGKVFSQKGNRKMHMYSHMKEKLFKCEVCEKTFKYPEQLKKHKFIHMAGEKLKCDSCDKLFPKQADLEKHMQTAHNGLMYVCNLCNSRCAHKHTLLRHYKRKHPQYVEQTKQDNFVNSLAQKVDMGEDASMITYTYVNESMGIPMETVTIEENALPQMAAQALKTLSGLTTDQQILTTTDLQSFSSADIINVPSIDGNFRIQNLVQDPNSSDDQQTVVILQIVNQENDQGMVSEEVEVIGNVVDLPEVKDAEHGQYVALT